MKDAKESRFGSRGRLLFLDLWRSFDVNALTSCPGTRCCPPHRSLLPLAQVVLSSRSAGSETPGSRIVVSPAGDDSCAVWILLQGSTA